MVPKKIHIQGFTFVELLIVISIITILSTVGISSYVGVQQGGRDTRRKADIQEIRGALEHYRENNSAYPTPASGAGLSFGTAPLSDAAGNIYLQTIPQDPQSPKRTYYYTTVSGDYSLGTRLEGTATCTVAPTPAANSCGTGFTCNYCYGSYGQK
ncbi:hypothetical protein A3D80_00395 [Candidatus Roizmanbacteria bacterium RIFCSPHIGHO2_02_FULL_40_13b]|uniref:Type II secretion system protein GspG C-terminal domain-containing protein n=1 Tax=Candidatus Roizmanbacteria bacterium RIFCSPHIGHO2_01_FULL_39_24 TaxID=1802032 RepID=A0A1F7GHP2_9BACT|nr:MAG: hypothetical protein A2799_03980 [Candidatus Roizmanbacteria bacterium RIFCSPHIGHO2_01_FULL_39_24]OGK26551.1 MAG: hypothetical protein A3D80_00395 [Candidatus Roizmanbacteria bacterium RIFCSPHIGHO2_02_FULL_40_13b]OGK49401.1 MAG: hypothetical protein A3A56_01890 [Candidatus Roizmanbacteria bacterium RIFCSPLOWO2_01_FULL_40_32]OGK56595.1 MAG: hypothetical protein A3H83_03425 [Candidatus Roizmanbacteria bacterium RIFCSPLOWO2_02_FULL_39_8]